MAGRVRFQIPMALPASAAANKGIDYFWQIASTMRGEKIFDQFGNLRLNKLVKKTRKKKRIRQQTT